jgi:hypothetical protein
MFKIISKKNLSATAITLSLVVGTLALSPVSTAFARPADARDLGRAYYVKQGAPVTGLHRKQTFVYDGSPFRAKFRSAFRIGNRSISHK